MNRQSPLHSIGLTSSCLNSGNSKTTSIKPRNNHHYNISYQNYHFNHLDQLALNLENYKQSSANGKDYDYLLKFLLVGDSDVGKEEILNGLNNENSFDNTNETQFRIDSTPGVNHSSTTRILLDGKRIKIQLWLVLFF